MLISLNWLKKYVDIKISDDDLVRLIGARLVEVEGVIDETKKYDNIFVVKVETCEKIEGTHLSLCQINTGNVELTQVVCGAPNVHAGMLAAWIAPGAIVPASVHEDAPFVIGKRKMLGKYDSFGMLAGADELDFGDDHSGIVEIDPSMAKPGDKLADIFELNDKILEIENKSLTHRPDCFGLIGFAREVAGILGVKFDKNENFLECPRLTRSGLSETRPVTTGSSERLQKASVLISDSSLCPRYSALVLEKHGTLTHKYLTWQDTILSKSGMRPVDPIVDATNYQMLLTGQPLHAFDYDKFVAVGGSKTPEIGVRIAKKSEKLVLLDDKEIELNENDIVITSNDIPVALAGAMGGKSTAIDENTKNIILESATFSLYNLRKTQMAHGIFSEAITRFTKGQPAYQTLSVANSCAKMLNSGFTITDEVDSYPTQSEPIIIKITTKEINALLGTNYSTDLIVKTLNNVGFQIEDSEQLKIQVPAWRTDIHIKEDIIEEVGRLLGYDNITPTLPLHATATKNSVLALKSRIREVLKSRGANELLTYTFTHGDLMEKVGQDKKNAYRIINSISPDLQYIRQSIVPSLLTKAYDNLKDGYREFVIFEMNQVYNRNRGVDEDGVPAPSHNLALVSITKNDSTNYYRLKLYLEDLTKTLGFTISLRSFAKTANEPYYEPKRSADIYINDDKIGTIGEIKASVARSLKLPLGTAALELKLEFLLNQNTHVFSHKISAYPFVYRDVTITTGKPYAEIEQNIKNILDSAGLINEISPVSIYQPDGEVRQNISFHLKFSHPNKTLSSDEITEIMEKISCL